MSDNTELISLAKSGDEAALTKIYNENANKVYFLCLKLLKNSEDAGDIMQDTFIKAFSNLEQLRDPNALSSWLLSIATSLCKNYLIRSKKFVFSSDDDENSAPLQNIEETDDAVLPEQYADNSETRRLVMDIIDRLPDGQRIAVILFYYNEMSIKEISVVLECSEDAVKNRLFNARKTIKEEVLKLEEKGTKLYSVPIIPLLGSILNYEAIGTTAPAMSSSLIASLMQAAQASTNIQPTAAATAKAAATGGKVMTKMTKIIIAALAAVVVAGGAITAAIISNNNNGTQTQEPVNSNSSANNSNSPAQGEESKTTSDAVVADVKPDIPVAVESDFKYEYNSELGGMVVTDYLNDSTDLHIPDTLEGKPVVGVNFNELEKELTQLIMPDSVKQFGLPLNLSRDSAYRASLTYVNIPAGVTSISDYCFDGCTSLASITIPDSVTEIGNVAFSGCTSLKNVIIPDSVTTVGNNVFYGCLSLKSVTIGNSVSKLGNEVFKNCMALESVNIPDSVTEIGNRAFDGCASLTSITIPEGVAEINKGAFYGCSSLKSVTIGNGVTKIGESAFDVCIGLTSIAIPDSVKAIDKYAFNNCKNLTSVTYKSETYRYENIDDLYSAINSN